jgi:hypothetical protein
MVLIAGVHEVYFKSGMKHRWYIVTSLQWTAMFGTIRSFHQSDDATDASVGTYDCPQSLVRHEVKCDNTEIGTRSDDVLMAWM